MMQEEKTIMDHYVLSQTFYNHNGAARSVDIKGDKLISSGIDKKVVYYERNLENGKFEKKSEFKFFKDYVYIAKIMEGEDQFMAGCKDNKIYICSFEDTEAPMLILEGHQGAVNSLSQSDITLVSGSWDATAKIWDLESGDCVATLPDHSYAVTTKILSTGAIVTGSQDGNLHIWDKFGNKRKSKNLAHKDIIRQIVEIKNIGILTCSNDGFVKLWSAENLEEFGAWNLHESFVFALGSLGGGDFVSGGEDFSLKVCRGGKVDEDGGDVLRHPSTVWDVCVAERGDQDLVTACGDGIVRIFTRNPTKVAPKDEIESLENEAKMAKISSNSELDEKTIKSFDTVDQLSKIPGKKEGEIRVFRHGMIPKAYMWKSNTWELIGDVMGSEQKPEKKYYEGDKYFPAGDYDYIINVQDDSGMVRRLPFNDGDNSLVAAEKFLVREGMNIGFKEQIINYIARNTRGSGKKIEKKVEKKVKKSVNLDPVREKKYYRKMNLDGLESKVIELNQDLRNTGQEEALTDNDLKHLKTLLVKLRDPKIYNFIKEFTSFEHQIIFKLLKFPSTHFIPILDLLRIFVTHHASQAFFSGLDSGISIFVSVASKLKNAPKVIWKIYFKFLCNMCMHDNNTLGIVKASDIIFNTFAYLNHKDKKLMVIVADFFMTLSSRFDVILTADDALAVRYIEAVERFLAFKADFNEEILLKFSISVVNFGVLKNGSRGTIKGGIGEMIMGELEGVGNKVGEVLKEKLRMIIDE